MASRISGGVRAALTALLVACTVAASPVSDAGAAAAADHDRDGGGFAASGWIWPVAEPRLVRAFAAPAHAYGPGHRGIDIGFTGAPAVRAPAAGFIAFSGPVAGRGILTIDHGGGLVTTLEPVESALRPGDTVARGDPVGLITVGGHTAPGAVHFGVRLHGDYINPLLLLGGVPRAILLPCCQ